MTSRFARLDHSLLQSPAYRSLSPNARALLLELAMMDNGSNNGRLWLSRADAAARMGLVDEKAAGAAFAELQEGGFIVMTQDADFRVKAGEGSRARCWRLTWVHVPGRSGPTNDYLSREPRPQTRARKRMDRGLRALKSWKGNAPQNRSPEVDSPSMTPFLGQIRPGPGVDSSPAKSTNNVFPPKLSEGDSTHHTAVPWGRECRPSFSFAWWQPNGLGPFIASMAAIDAASRFNQQSEYRRLAA
jgi:hypothetical protein